ncbi:hypothetical protein evm_008486 [Chilo suppressalis]|nr:hypothetical protein evm_008486 [Chilo suppressalis]
MASATVIWSIVVICSASVPRVNTENSIGICRSKICNKIDGLHVLKDCVVILGNLKVLLLEQAHKDDFRNISFPKLKEVSGFVLFYRVNGLESIGQLFPNLAVIGGRHVLYNFALIIYDMPDLKEVGLYSLMRIYKGGVVVWAVPQVCYVHTINWEVIAPRARHVLSSSEGSVHCNTMCSCTTNTATNHCWNIKKCQRYLEGPDKEKCNDLCLGCRNINPDSCSNCRYKTYKGNCVRKCPADTLELQDVGYCITEAECHYLAGWKFKNFCVFNCSTGYEQQITSTGYSCMPCNRCEETCENVTIHALGHLQDASRCVKINGSLIISIRSLPETMTELRTYLKQVEEVTDYIVVYGMPTVTSLDFLSSLRKISGRVLRNGTYSLLVYDMISLQSLFTENVTKNLKIGRGTMLFNNNPMLCMSELEKIVPMFPIPPVSTDVPQGANGYSGGCTTASVSLNVNVLNETSVAVHFTHIEDPYSHYSILYIRFPQGSRKIFVPETCSDTDWYAYNIPTEIHNNSIVQLNDLQPASSYALCIEKYDPVKKILARSDIVNFSTPVGKPEPPFILELVASSSEVVVLRWVDHKIYRPHIKRYELDVVLVDIYPEDVAARDHCKDVERYEEIDIFRHAVVMRPPAEYDRCVCCESMCGILSSVTEGAMVEEYFDVCSSIEYNCNNVEAPPPANSSYGKFLRSLSLNIKGPRNDFQVGGLAPFRDYRFRLRACSDQCSRSARGVVRTLRADYADMPKIIYASANENGFIAVKWEPPEVTNGPVLSYSVQVLPSLKLDDISRLIPQVWCQSAEKTFMIVKSVKAKTYLVSVCSKTLASRNVCSANIKVVISSNVSWWAGIVFAIVLFTTTTIATLFIKKRRDYSYELPLLSNIMATDESEPPSTNMSDFVELYSIPLRDTELK